MNLLNNKKLLILPIVIVVSLLFSSFLFFNQIDKLKKQIDGLYFGTFLPIHKLHKVVNTYEQIINQEALTIKNKELIENNWKSYYKSYKSVKERDILNNIELIIEKSFKVYDEKLLRNIINNLNNTIDYEVNIAYLQRKEFISQYEKTYDYLKYSLIIILILSVLLVSYVAYLSMQKHTALEKLSMKYKQDSITDSLSLLYNRKYFDTVFSNLTNVASENQWKCAFVMLDIDYFKPFNDTYGHDMGDMVIKSVANTLKRSFNKQYEYIFRIGGEEFGIIIMDTNINLLDKSLENLQNNIKSLKIPHSASQTGFLTVSMGVIIVDENSTNMEVKELYKQADDKLYYSKEHGRNQYTI